MRSVVALGLAACLLVAGCGRTSPRRAWPPPTRASGGATAAPAQAVPRPMLVWTPGRLPAGFAGRVGALAGVRRAVAVVSGTVWLARSRDTAGRVVDQPPPGMAIPLDLAGASPKALAPLLPAADHRLLAALDRGGAILGATSARLRRLGPGGTLELSRRSTPATRTVRVVGVLPDQDLGRTNCWSRDQ